MADYQVTPAKLQELNVLIDKGGHIPTDVSNALAQAQIDIAAGDDAAANRSIDKAVAANIRNAGVYSEIQVWHDQVKSGGTVPTQPPPPYSPPWANPVGSGGTLNMSAVWGDPQRLTSESAGGFPPDGCVSVAFTTPATVPPGGSVQTAEFGGPPVWRDINIATQPAVFSGPQVLVNANNALTPTVNFPTLQPNTQYYVNVRNSTPAGDCSCTSGYQCNLLVQFTWPI